MPRSKTIKTPVTRAELTEVIDAIGDLQCQAKPNRRAFSRVKKIVATIARRKVKGKVNMSNIGCVSMMICTITGKTTVGFFLDQGEGSQGIKLDLQVGD